MSLLKNLGFDGIDVDWEYPSDTTEAAHLVELLRTVREELDHYASTLDGTPRFLLTAAFSADPQRYKWLDIVAIERLVDYWVLMAYDYATSSSEATGYLANLRFNDKNPESTPFNTTSAVEGYIAKGASSHKITLGMPLYGRWYGHAIPWHRPGRAGSWSVGL